MAELVGLVRTVSLERLLGRAASQQGQHGPVLHVLELEGGRGVQREQAQQQAHILLECARQISEVMPRLRSLRDMSHYTVEIHRLENDGDRLERLALASLFERAVDPMMVIRWKDIFERLESAVDATEKVANTIQGIVLKNS